MKLFIKKYFFFLLTVVFISGCSEKKVAIPHDVIPMKQMVDIMTDVHLAEATKETAMTANPSKNDMNGYYIFIFNKHHVTKEQFQRSLEFYRSKPDLMEEVYTEVINKLSELQAKPGNH